jgi:hypothetical protein
MATQAAQMPGGIDTTLYDLGRMIGLWVSAFEILARPKDRPSDKWRVFALLEKVRYLDRNVRRKRYLVQIGRNKSGRRALALWLYERLYDARNAFLHGNPLARNALTPASGARESLFILAAPLYRLALTGFLDMPLQSAADSSPGEDLIDTAVALLELRLSDTQGVVERAILRARKQRA